MIGEIHVAKDAPEAKVGILDGRESHVEMLAYLRGLFADRIPSMLGRDMEAMLFRVSRLITVAGLGKQLLEFLVPNVAKPLIEKQTKDVLLVVPSIDMTAKNVRRLP